MNISISLTPKGYANVVTAVDVPINFVIAHHDTSNILLNWNSVAGNEDGFSIERSIGNNSNFVEIHVAGNGDVEYTDTGLTPNVYYYRMRAFVGSTYSSYTSEVYTLITILDELLNVQAIYSVRQLLSGYEGNCLLLRRSSDNAELAFGFLANGDLDAAAIASWLGGASGYVTTWYDQSSNGRHLVQTTADNQPLYVASGPNSKPTVRFDGTNDRLRVTFSNVAAPHHIFSCLKQNTWVSGRYIFDGGNTGQCAAIQFDASAELAMAAGGLGTQVDFTTTAYSVGVFFFRNVANQYYIRRNGTQPASAAAIVGVANVTGIVLGCLGNQTSFGNVDVSEWFLFNSEQSNSPIEANMGTYYNITVV